MKRVAGPLLAALCLLALIGGAGAASPPGGFIDTTLVTGIGPKPTSMAWDPASARLFITMQPGDLRVVEDGTLLPAPFMHLDVDYQGGRGLLGVALDPNFATNHYLYVAYNLTGSPPHNRISRFTAQGNVVEPGSELVLLDIDLVGTSTGHHIESLHFGPDGKLYATVGDMNDGANAKTLTNLLGKVLRMNSDGSIPADNPFYNTATGKNRLIWAYGFRNPFTFAVQPGTGRIFVNDVGAHKYEEVDDILPGKNYGWPLAEATSTDPAFTNPAFCYRHSDFAYNPADTKCASTNLTGCSITGGDFYNPPVASFPPEYVGRYFFSDMCGGWVGQLDPGSGAVSDFVTLASTPIDVDTGPDGSLYYLEYRNLGRVGRISYLAAPTVTGFSPARGPAGTEVTIDGTYLADATDVEFDGVPADFTVAWDTRIVATVPAGGELGPIRVTTGAGTAESEDDFGATTVSGFSPASGPVGTSVTISGSGFTGTTGVEFNGTAAQSFAVDSDVQITAVVAAGSTSGPVAVTSPGGTGTSAGSFTVIPPAPAISGFSPMKGPVGASVVVTGNRFAGATAVKFHGTDAQSFTVDSSTQITAFVAAGTTSGQISVTTPGGTGTTVRAFTVLPPPPSITGFNPTSGIAGTSVTINGAGFTGAGAVKFNGLGAQSFVVNSDTKITAVVRVSSTSGPITVVGPGGPGTSVGTFTVPQPPTISSFSPTSGRAGVTITILGARFTGATRVQIHGTNAKSFAVVSSTQINTVVKPGTTSGPIVVTTPLGKATSAGTFTVLP